MRKMLFCFEFVLIFFLLNLAVYAQPIDIPNHPEAKNFFPARDGLVKILFKAPTSQAFGDLSKNSKNFRKIPLTFLNSLGFRNGTVIQEVRSDGSVRTYTLKTIVNVILHPHVIGEEVSSNDLPWASFSIITSDDPSVHTQFSEASNLEGVTGFAYVGELYKLTSSSLAEVDFKGVVPLSHPILKQFATHGFPKPIIKEGKIGNSSLFSDEDIPTNDEEGIRVHKERMPWIHSVWLKNETNVFVPVMFDSNGRVQYGEWIKGMPMAILSKSERNSGCLTIYFFNHLKTQKASLTCP